MAPMKRLGRASEIRRYTIRSPEEADEPRSRLELNALQALGAILDKRQWWTKWTTRADVHAQWIHELEAAVVEANVTQVLAVWPPQPTKGLQKQVEILDKALAASTAESRKVVETLVGQLMYPTPEFGFDEGQVYLELPSDESECETESDEEDEEGDEEMEEGEDDSEDETALDEDGNVVAFDVAVAQAKKTHGIVDDDGGRDDDGDATMDQDEEADGDDQEAQDEEEMMSQQKKKNAFGQIAWYATMLVLLEAIRALPSAEWGRETVNALIAAALETRADPKVVARTCSLILAVVRENSDEPCSLEVLKHHLPEEQREDVLRILQLHLKAIHKLVRETTEDISSVLDVVTQRLALPAKEEDMAPSSPLRTPGPVPHTWMSDDLISNELKTRFVHQIAALENVPEEEKDWHPDSNEQVLDLVHPSLYCGVIGETMRLPQSAAKRMYGSAAEHMKAIMFAPAKTKLGGPKNKSTKFQWLPSEVEVDEDEEGGNATILTYINNLHPESFAGLYGSIESIFTQFVPLFDTVLSSLDDQADDRTATALYHHGGSSLACMPNLCPPGLFETSSPQFSLKGTRCQVIVKIAEIHLTPQKPEYAGGSWHIEGTDAERIIATGIYYFGSENITDSRLSFRTFVERPQSLDNHSVGVALQYGLQVEQLLIQNLGGVSCVEDRCVVFPNIYQHKVEPFRLADTTKPGVRKILAFFLVDPTQKPIPSTAVVPPQQQEWIDLAREPQSKRARVPTTTTEEAKDTAREGLSPEDARVNRVKLMSERSPAQQQGGYDYVFSLCEH